MISLELSTIQAKNAERAMLAEAMAAYNGRIQVIDVPVARSYAPHSWRGDLMLPGSSQATMSQNQDAALTVRIRELVAKGCGITSIKMTLRIDARRIKRLCEAAGIELKDRRGGLQHCEHDTHQSKRDAGKLRRTKLALKLKPLAANGATVNEMAAATGVSRNTVMTTMREFCIPRGPKMDLSK